MADSGCQSLCQGASAIAVRLFPIARGLVYHGGAALVVFPCFRKLLSEASALLGWFILRFVLPLAFVAALAHCGDLRAQLHRNSACPDGVSLSSPLDYQVFQRSALMKGKVTVDGRLCVPADRIEVRLTGDSLRGPLRVHWVHLHADRLTGNFHASVPATPGGFYQLQVRAFRSGEVVAAASVPHVGVGEVFVVSGQSNATNYGEVRQVTETGMVVAFDGASWRLANDPQPGVQDGSTKGSFIPSFGDALFRKYGVPIGVADVGHGSTSVRQWLPAGFPIFVIPTMTKFVQRNAQGELVSDGMLFSGMMNRIHQLGRHGFRALLWHQGESDSNQKANHQISAELYRRMMVELIHASRKDAGWNFPWFVAVATYQPTAPSAPSIEAAQRSLWRRGLAYQGPDTDTLGAGFRQNQGKGVHFNAEGLQRHGEMWAAEVEAYLDPVLNRDAGSSSSDR